MKLLRIDLVKNYIKNFCKNLSVTQVQRDPSIGVSSLDIVENLNILRNNASADLNKLYKNGFLIKIKGKPTKYFDKDYFEELFHVFLGDESIECYSL